ncbi:MAG: PDZ domain-containing protein [Verrucomicrobiae bacterium]|nr:PDZ domain-containing protein [Verrucomicrobiae bacterium]
MTITMSFRSLCFLSAIFAVASSASAAPVQETDLRRDAVVIAVEKVAPAVVNIATERVVEYRDPFEDMFSNFFRPYHQRGTQRSLGSGVFVDDSGYLVTNFHVVQRASKITVILTDGTQLEGKFIAGSERNDLALIKVSRDKTFPFVPIARDDVLLGETVVAIGNPFGFGNSVTHGIVSSKDRTAVDNQGNVVVEGVLQTDAAINPGNSGGPLVDLRAELVGINTAIIQQAQNIGFAIPARRVAELLGEWLSLEKRKHIWFGVRFKQEQSKIEIAEVQAESPAAKANIRAGEVVTSVDGQPAQSIADISRVLLRKEVGQTVKLGLNADKPRVVEVKLTALPKFSANELAQQKLGIQLQELTPDLGRALALSSQRGVVVSDVERNSSAWNAGLRRGHVIARIGGSDVNSLDDAARVLEDAPRKVNLTLLVISSTRQGNAIVEQVSAIAVTTR